MNKKDFRVDRFRASGNGGQNVNKVESAVRITHLPTGLVATSQDERSQGRNYKKAMETLLGRIADQESRAKADQRNDLRREQQNRGRVRTYNLITNLMTDNIRGVKAPIAREVLDGDLDLIPGMAPSFNG